MANQIDPMLGGNGRSEGAKGAVALFKPWMQDTVAAAPPRVRPVFATPDAVADGAKGAKTTYLTSRC